MKVIVDSREQCPYLFQGKLYEGVTTIEGTLQSGDYSLAGLTDRIAVERKSLPDLIQCLGKDRDRFRRELERAQGLEFFAVVIEADWGQLAKGQYHGMLNQHSACQSVAAFMARYRIPFHFAGTRGAAEYCCWSLLKQYLQGAEKRLQAIIKAHGSMA